MNKIPYMSLFHFCYCCSFRNGYLGFFKKRPDLPSNESIYSWYGYWTWQELIEFGAFSQEAMKHAGAFGKAGK